MIRFPRRFAVGLVFASLLGCGNQEAPEQLLASAKNYLARNEPRAAVVQLKNALQKSPNSAEARFLLGKALLESEDPASATVELTKAADLKYPADAVEPLLARSLVQQGQNKAVTDRYALTTLSTPAATADLKTSVALAYASQGDVARSQAALASALQVVPDYVPALIFRSRLMAGRRDFAGAFKVLDSALAKAPEDHDALVLKGDLLEASGDAPAAIAAYKRALAVRKDSLVAHAAIVSILLARNELAPAKEQLEALKVFRPNHPQVKYLEAQLAYQKRDFKSANASIEQALKAWPENPLMLQLAGALAYEAGSLAQAESLLGKALRGRPTLIVARRLLTQVYSRTRQSDKALATIAPLLTGAPKPEDLALAASVHLQQGNAVKAEELLANAVKLDPKDTRNRVALAMTHMYGDNPKAALDELESLAEADTHINADLALIEASMTRKDFSAALKALDRLEKKLPRRALVPSLRGKVLIAKGDFQGARQSFQRALALDPKYFPAVGSLAALDVKDNKTAAAETRFQELLKAQPDNTPALLAMAQLRAKAGKKEEVVALLTKAIKLDPRKPAPLLLLIDYHLRNGDIKQALGAAQDAVAAAPDSGDLLDALARSQVAAKDFNQAIATYNKLLTLQPKSPTGYVGLADAYIAVGKNEDALRAVSSALAIAPEYLPAQQRAIALEVTAGHDKQALTMARTVQSQRPTKAIGLIFEGDIEAANKNWPRAATLYRNALQREASAEAARKLHTSLNAGGKRAEADVWSAQWIKDHPRDADFLLHLANLALIEQKYDAAEQGFLQVVKLQPDRATALNSLAWTLAKLGKPGALDYAERANKLEPEQPAFMDTLAMILAKENQLPKAIALQQRAVSLAPQARPLRLALAKLYVQAGDKASARKELEPLARLGDKFTGHSEVRQLLDSL